MSDVVLIGAGRVATSLGMAAVEKGHRVTKVYSRTLASASRLASRIGCDADTDLATLPQDADVYIVAVSDAALPDVASRAPFPDDKLCLHTAGSVTIDVFPERLKLCGVLYPMQTFSMDRRVRMDDVPCFVEARTGAGMEKLRAFASTLSSRVYELSGNERRYLHLGAVFACNFANHCYAIAEKIYRRHGIPFDALLPLIDETARKVHQMSPVSGQSGPAVRGDRNVMEAQLSLLEAEPLWTDVYRLMSRDIGRMRDEAATAKDVGGASAEKNKKRND